MCRCNLLPGLTRPGIWYSESTLRVVGVQQDKFAGTANTNRPLVYQEPGIQLWQKYVPSVW